MVTTTKKPEPKASKDVKDSDGANDIEEGAGVARKREQPQFNDPELSAREAVMKALKEG